MLLDGGLGIVTKARTYPRHSRFHGNDAGCTTLKMDSRLRGNDRVNVLWIMATAIPLGSLGKGLQPLVRNCSELFGIVWSCSELAKLRRRGLGNLEVFDALA